jgi:transposase
VWFLLDVVAGLDTSALHARSALRRDGQPARGSAGRAGYDPVLLLVLLIYAYGCGERSSRVIERLCTENVAFRVLCADDPPDHTVIARFRQTHAEVFTDLFTQVLGLCRAAGLARLGTVAIDGSKIAANASMRANRGRKWLDAEAAKLDCQPGGHQPGGHQPGGHGAGGPERGVVEQILTAAAETDAAEDARLGPARGDELPPQWANRHRRRERIRAALAKLEAEQAAQAAERAAAAAEQAERDAAALAKAQAVLQAEIVARHAARQAWEQAWEHAAAHPGAPLPRGRAPVPVEQSGQLRRARDRVERARQRLTHPDTTPRPGRRANPDRHPEPRANITDPDSGLMPTHNGWIQGYNTQFAVTADQIILAIEVSTNPADIVSFESMLEATQHSAADLAATDELGTLLLDAGYCSKDTLTATGPDRLIALGKTRSVRAAARDNPATGPPPPDASPHEAMDHRLRTPEGAQLYTRRAATAEPGIGNFKKILDRFSRRGTTAATSEAHLAGAVFNLLKIHRAATA